MQLRPEMQIQSMIKAMTEVVLPAVDQTNELAFQQAQLITGHLVLLARRLPLQYRSDCDELERLVSYAATLGEKAGGDAALEASRAAAADTLSRACAEPAELVTSINNLTGVLDKVIRNAFATGNEVLCQEVQTATLAMSKAQLLRDRAWLIMQGWEPDPESVPAVETLLPAING